MIHKNSSGHKDLPTKLRMLTALSGSGGAVFCGLHRKIYTLARKGREDYAALESMAEELGGGGGVTFDDVILDDHCCGGKYDEPSKLLPIFQGLLGTEFIRLDHFHWAERVFKLLPTYNRNIKLTKI